METLVLYALCTSSIFYLGSRAELSRPLWSRYPSWLAKWADCSACSGFWYGLGVAAFGGYALHLSFLGMPGDRAATVAFAGLASLTWTPIVAGFMQRGFDTLGTIDLNEPPAEVDGTGPTER